MFKKLTMLAMAVGALIAFAAPAIAQAEVTLLDKEGEPVALNQKITATSTTTTTQTAGGELTCTLVGITGKLTANGPHITIEPDGSNPTVTTQSCTSSLGPAHITAKVDKVTITTGGVGTAFGVTFNSVITSPIGELKCHFSNSALPLSWDENGIGIPHATNGAGETTTNLTGVGPCGNGDISSHGNSFKLFREVNGTHVEQLTIVEH